MNASPETGSVLRIVCSQSGMVGVCGYAACPLAKHSVGAPDLQWAYGYARGHADQTGHRVMVQEMSASWDVVANVTPYVTTLVDDGGDALVHACEDRIDSLALSPQAAQLVPLFKAVVRDAIAAWRAKRPSDSKAS